MTSDKGCRYSRKWFNCWAANTCTNLVEKLLNPGETAIHRKDSEVFYRWQCRVGLCPTNLSSTNLYHKPGATLGDWMMQNCQLWKLLLGNQEKPIFLLNMLEQPIQGVKQSCQAGCSYLSWDILSQMELGLPSKDAVQLNMEPFMSGMLFCNHINNNLAVLEVRSPFY